MNKKIILILLFCLSIIGCKRQQSLKQILDMNIENESFDEVKNLKGKYFKYGSNIITTSSYGLNFHTFLDQNKYYDNPPAIHFYYSDIKKKFTIAFVDFDVVPIKKSKKTKGLDSVISEVCMFSCEPGYTLLPFRACEYDENRKIVLSDNVFCLRKAKITDEGKLEDIVIWYKKLTPDYVIIVKTPDEFVIEKGSESKYFYYYDENHY